MRWMPALLLCGCLAIVSAVAYPSPHTLAMQDVPPSDAARAFCSADEEISFEDDSIFEPAAETVGAATVSGIENSNPDPGASDSGKLYLTFVTLPQHSCILGSYFFPAVVITVTSGNIEMFMEHWPGTAAAPEAFVRRAGQTTSEELAPDMAIPVNSGDWVKIENESFVGFRNQTDADAVFVVAGLKPDGEPGEGGCSGGCRNRP